MCRRRMPACGNCIDRILPSSLPRLLVNREEMGKNLGTWKLLDLHWRPHTFDPQNPRSSLQYCTQATAANLQFPNKSFKTEISFSLFSFHEPTNSHCIDTDPSYVKPDKASSKRACTYKGFPTTRLQRRKRYKTGKTRAGISFACPQYWTAFRLSSRAQNAINPC